jgi:6-phosphogluconolactonase
MASVIKVYNTANDLFANTAELIAGLITSLTRLYGRCTLVLSGGSTPDKLYDLLAENYKSKIEWNKVYIFWGDERCVPPDDKESNYRSAKEHLLDKVNIPPENIFRIHAEDNPDKATSEYEKNINDFFKGGEARFDIILLGLGTDGHTASLFPGTEGLNEKHKLAVKNYTEDKKTPRITLTYKAINNAKNIIFLISGEEKKAIVKKIFINKEKNYPAVKVEPVNGSLFYLLDKNAAGELKIEKNI